MRWSPISIYKLLELEQTTRGTHSCLWLSFRPKTKSTLDFLALLNDHEARARSVDSGSPVVAKIVQLKLLLLLFIINTTTITASLVY